MKIVSFYKLTDSKRQDFFNWLQSEKNDEPAYKNMWDDDWLNKPNTLPYLLNKTEKYKSPNGDFTVIYDDKKITGCGAVYKAPFNSNIALAGTRTWIDTNYRNKFIVREQLLPTHKAWAINNNCKQIVLCFNDYNKNLKEIWKRKRLGENRSARQPHHIFYSNFNELDFPVMIQKTPQWVIYEKLDPDWNFNWQIIRC